MSVARRVGPADPAQRNSSTSTRPTSSRAAVPVSGASGASERADARMQAERRLTTPSLSSPTRTTTRTRTTRRRRTTTTTRMRRSPRRRTTTERRLSAPRPSIYLALSALRPVVSVVGPINPGLRLNVRPARQPSPSVSAASQPVPRLSRQQREIFPLLANAPVLECSSDAPAPPSRPERVWPSQRPRSIQQRAALHLSDGPAHSEWLKSTPSILALAAPSVQGHRSTLLPTIGPPIPTRFSSSRRRRVFRSSSPPLARSQRHVQGKLPCLSRGRQRAPATRLAGYGNSRLSLAIDRPLRTRSYARSSADEHAQQITLHEVSQHNTAESGWVVIEGPSFLWTTIALQNSSNER